jgi:hypothetical protein
MLVCEQNGNMSDSDLKLSDVQKHENLIVRCVCGYSVHSLNGGLQKHARLSADTLIRDLPKRLRCKRCGQRGDVEISIQDGRFIGTSCHLPEPRVMVPWPVDDGT